MGEWSVEKKNQAFQTLGISMFDMFIKLAVLRWSRGQDLGFQCGECSSVPGQGAGIPHALWPEHQNIKWKEKCNKFNKDFKNGPCQKTNERKLTIVKGLPSHCLFGLHDALGQVGWNHHPRFTGMQTKPQAFPVSHLRFAHHKVAKRPTWVFGQVFSQDSMIFSY